MISYEPHQQRVVTEQKELQEKLDKLKDFFNIKLFSTINKAEQDRLKMQAVYMTSYNDILKERIKEFSK